MNEFNYLRIEKLDMYVSHEDFSVLRSITCFRVFV